MFQTNYFERTYRIKISVVRSMFYFYLLSLAHLKPRECLLHCRKGCVVNLIQIFRPKSKADLCEKKLSGLLFSIDRSALYCNHTELFGLKNYYDFNWILELKSISLKCFILMSFFRIRAPWEKLNDV